MGGIYGDLCGIMGIYVEKALIISGWWFQT